MCLGFLKAPATTTWRRLTSVVTNIQLAGGPECYLTCDLKSTMNILISPTSVAFSPLVVSYSGATERLLALIH